MQQNIDDYEGAHPLDLLVAQKKRIAELEAALRLCIENCIDPTEGEVALTRACYLLAK